MNGSRKIKLNHNSFFKVPPLPVSLNKVRQSIQSLQTLQDKSLPPQWIQSSEAVLDHWFSLHSGIKEKNEFQDKSSVVSTIKTINTIKSVISMTVKNVFRMTDVPQTREPIMNIPGRVMTSRTRGPIMTNVSKFMGRSLMINFFY